MGGANVVVDKAVPTQVWYALSAESYHHSQPDLLHEIPFTPSKELNTGDTIRLPGKSAWYKITMAPHEVPYTIDFSCYHTAKGYDSNFQLIKRISGEFYRETDRHQRHMAFEIPASQQPEVYYFKSYAATIQRDDHAELHIQDAEKFDRAFKNTWYEDRMLFVIMLLVLGVGIFQILYISSLAWSRRKPEYWDYLGFIITAVIMIPISRRFELAMGEVPWIISSSDFSYFGILNLFYCRFVRNYLNTEQTNPVVYRQLKWAEYILIGCIITHSIIYLTTRDEEYTNQYYMVNGAGFMGLNFYFLVLFLRQRSILTNYLLAGAATMVISGLGKYVYMLLMEWGFFSKSRYFDLITLVGGVVDTIILNLALNYKHRKENLARQMALQNERNRIAKDLHDDVGTEMSSMALASYTAERSGDPVRMREALQTIVKQSSRLGEDMRDIVWSIHPENDSVEKIAVRMRQFAARMLEGQGVDVYFQIAPNALPLKMQPEARKNLYLFFKEAIHNIARHARCTRTDVSIWRENGAFVLEISDDGQGFDPKAPLQTTGGNGLRNMQHRGEVLGGKLVVESAPGEGTVVRLVAPLV